MKPTELRIGNWYESVKFKQPVQCDLSDLYNLCAMSDGAYNDPPIDEMFEPIPLTEEWLKKFGFNCEINNKDSGYKQYEINDCGFGIEFSIEIGVAPECYLEAIGIDIEYVHQLQNLYFALTGKELENREDQT